MTRRAYPNISSLSCKVVNSCNGRFRFASK